MSRSITIGRLSAATGVNIETIRYYEKIGLTGKPRRSAAGRRLYDAQDISCLNFIRRGRELGFSLNAIGSLLALEAQHAPCSDAKAITELHLEDIRARIADLKRLEDTLSKLAAACDLSEPSQCPVIDALGRDTSPQ